MSKLRVTSSDARVGMPAFFVLVATVVVPRVALGQEARGDAERLFFTSQGKTGIIGVDGSGLRYLEFDAPNQATWQPGPIFADGRRAIFLSMEPRRDGPGRPFDEYYTQTPTHLWLYDLADGRLEEICTRERMAPFVTPALLVGEDRLLVQVVKDRVGQIWSVRLDGSDAREFTKAGEGLPYGLSLSPDGKRVAYHLASPQGYQVWTADTDGANRVRLAADPAHLYFGTAWSPDGQWVVYVDCQYQTDPGHDWADVCVGRADGSEHRVLTSCRPMWFAAAYGNPDNRGGGSNVPAWLANGKIVYPRLTPDAKLPWRYRTGQPDVDHFNREYLPEEAQGGCQIFLLDLTSGSERPLTVAEENVWDFRATPSPDGRRIAFCRAKTGEGPAIWVMDADGANARRLTAGVDQRGADHPRWVGGAGGRN